jgi:hypothetical protein
MFDTWILAHFLELDSTVLGRKSAFVHIWCVVNVLDTTKTQANPAGCNATLLRLRSFMLPRKSREDNLFQHLSSSQIHFCFRMRRTWQRGMT